MHDGQERKFIKVRFAGFGAGLVFDDTRLKTRDAQQLREVVRSLTAEFGQGNASGLA